MYNSAVTDNARLRVENRELKQEIACQKPYFIPTQEMPVPTAEELKVVREGTAELCETAKRVMQQWSHEYRQGLNNRPITPPKRRKQHYPQVPPLAPKKPKYQ